jgi:hypothetical protein
MAWPSVTAGQSVLASQFNALSSAIQSWQGFVSAAGFGATDLLSIGFHTGNATWQEWQLKASAGASQTADLLLLQSNARNSSGGTDSWGSVLTLSTGAASPALDVLASVAFSGPVGLNGGVTLGSAANLNGQTINGSASFAGALNFSGSATFTTPANIIFGSNWQTWTPTFTGIGSMTITGVTVIYAVYLRVGPFVMFHLGFSGTLGGTASTSVLVTLPVAVAGIAAGTPVQGMYQPELGNGASYAAGFCFLNSLNATQMNLALCGAPLPTYPLGAITGYVSGFYRCA